MVIAIIAILAGLLLPALSKAKAKAVNLACLNNLKQLEVCWHLYATDNRDYLAPNNSVYGIGLGSYISQGVSWCPEEDAKTNLSSANIESGVLFQYNRAVAIYHCPADRSTLQTATGEKLPQLRFRSYNMSQSVNGFPEFNDFLFQFLPAHKKFSNIARPPTSKLFVFIDEHEDSIVDAQFGNPPRGSPYFQQNVWWDIPANRHNQAGNLSFADGHVEHWRWKVPKVFQYFVQPVPPQEMPDYTRIQDAMKQPADE